MRNGRRNVNEEGFSGFSTEGPNRYYFPENLPRHDERAEADSLFNKTLYGLASDLKMWPEMRTKDNLDSLNIKLQERGYLGPQDVYGGWNHHVQGAANRYVKNFEDHPENSIMHKLMDWLKGF